MTDLRVPGRAVDVAVVADDAEVVVVDAVRAAVYAAASARDLGVVDLVTLGLADALATCVNVECRRHLARRRGAEWHVVVGEQGSHLVLRLQSGDDELAHGVLSGTAMTRMGGVVEAVDALFESAMPQALVTRERLIEKARAASDRGDHLRARTLWAEAFPLVADDRAVEITFARVRLAEWMGDELGLDRAFDEAERALLSSATVSGHARELFLSALLEYRSFQAISARDIAQADLGPDHASLLLTAARLFERMADQDAFDQITREGAREEAALLRAELEPMQEPKQEPAVGTSKGEPVQRATGP